MVKSYPGFGPIFLILFFTVIGTWMFINPLLNDVTNTHKLNYGGLLFTAIGFSLTFTLKKITLWKEGIQVNYLVTRKQNTFSRNEILQITIEEEKRTYIEIYFSSRKRHPSRITIQFKNKNTADLVLKLAVNTSYHPMKNFLRENYAELINEQECE